VTFVVTQPELSLPDALGAAYSALRGYDLATLDIASSRAPGVTTYVLS
jgi:hypothetical protein